MKVLVYQKEFLIALNMAAKAASGRSTAPILSNILVEASTDGVLTIIGTDIQTTVTTWVTAQVEKEGVITMPARTVVDLVKSYPPDMLSVASTASGDGLNFKSGTSKFTLKGIPADGFPLAPVPTENPVISINASDIKSAIQEVIFAHGSDEQRPNLMGVYFKFSDGVATVVSSDSFQIAVAHRPGTFHSKEPVEFIVPAKALENMLSVFPSDSGHSVDIFFQDSRFAIFRFIRLAVAEGQVDEVVMEIAFQLVEYAYPAIENVGPREIITEFKVNRQAIIERLRQMAIMSRDNGNLVVFNIPQEKSSTKSIEQSVLLHSVSAERGEGETEINATVVGNALSINLHGEHIVSYLNSISNEEVAFSFENAQSPVRIFPVGAEGHYITLPLSIATR